MKKFYFLIIVLFFVFTNVKSQNNQRIISATSPAKYVKISQKGSLPIYEDFEDKDLSDWTLIGGDTEVDSISAIGRNYCLKKFGASTNHYQGVRYSFTNTTPDYFSVYVKTTNFNRNTGYISLSKDSQYSGQIFLSYFGGDDSLRIYGNQVKTIEYRRNIWYHIELKNINFTTHTYDCYINDTLFEAGMTFRNNTDEINAFDYYNYQSSTSYIDNLLITSSDYHNLTADIPLKPTNNFSSSKIAVVFTNNGNVPESNFSAGYTFQGSTVQSTYTGTLQAHQTDTMYFPNTYDLSVEDFYDLSVFVNSADDTYSADDTIITKISSYSDDNVLALDGVNDYIETNFFPVKNDKFSYSMWVKYETTGTEKILLSSCDNQKTWTGMWFEIGTSQKLKYFDHGFYTSNNTIQPNEWTYVTITYEPGFLKFYINGILDASYSKTFSSTDGANLFIGTLGENLNYYCKASLDDISIWNTALRDNEIKHLMHNPADTSDSRLIAFYDFNSGISSGNNTMINHVADLTGNYNGRLRNFNLSNGNSNSNFVETGILKITAQPRPADICVNDSLSIFVNATGDTVEYQWFWNGSKLNGVTTDTIDIITVQANSGNYFCQISQYGDTINSDTVSILINQIPNVEATSQIICSDTTTLIANQPTNGQNGQWSVISGSGIFADATLFNSKFSGVNNLSTSTLKWTIANNGCARDTTITITNNMPNVTASNQIACSDTIVLNGSQPPAQGNGIWKIISGSGALTDSTLFNTEITGITSEATTSLQWTISYKTCTDSVQITATNNQFTVSAGIDTVITIDSIQLQGDDPHSGTGSWLMISGGGAFANVNLFNTVISYLSQGDNILRWTVNRNGCSAFDEVTITYNPTNIDDILATDISVYPNPAKNLIKISSNNDVLNITITDISGNVLLKQNQAQSLDISGLPAGIYLIKIRTNDGIFTRKIIKE